jgi:hypothetical protein
MADVAKSFVLITIWFEEDFKYDKRARFSCNVGANAESLFVEFCNFVQCRIFVNYLTWCLLM